MKLQRVSVISNETASSEANNSLRGFLVLHTSKPLVSGANVFSNLTKFFGSRAINAADGLSLE